MKTIIAAITVLIALTACSPKETTSKYSEGQVWTFKAGKDEPAAKFTVVKVDAPEGKERIIFVSLSEVQLGTLPAYQFIPFSEEALNRSAKTKVSDDGALTGADAEAFKQYYESWQTGVASGAYEVCYKDNVGEVWAQRRASAPKAD